MINSRLNYIKCCISYTSNLKKKYSLAYQKIIFTLPFLNFSEDREDTTESDFFFFINACRCKDKKHLFTDVSSFDSSDGIIVNQDRLRLQEGIS